MLEVFKNNLGMFQENTYFIKDSESGDSLIIDPGYYDENAVSRLFGESAPIYIIATHTHIDHVKALDKYKERFPSAEFMFNREDYGFGEDVKADSYLKDNDILPFGKVGIKVISTPGHTPGGICLLIGNTLFSGDTLFKMSVGRTDLIGGSFEDLLSSVKDKLFVLGNNTRVMPGHGDETTIGFEKKGNPFV